MLRLFNLEQFAYEVHFTNPLKIPLNLLQLTLLWEFTAQDQANVLVTNKVSLVTYKIFCS